VQDRHVIKKCARLGYRLQGEALTSDNNRSDIMIKAKTNRKARRLFGMTHWTSNRFRVVFNETSNGGEWQVEKKRK